MHVTAASHSTSDLSVPPHRVPAALKKPAVLLRSSVELQEQATEPELSSEQGRRSGLRKRVTRSEDHGVLK